MLVLLLPAILSTTAQSSSLNEISALQTCTGISSERTFFQRLPRSLLQHGVGKDERRLALNQPEPVKAGVEAVDKKIANVSVPRDVVLHWTLIAVGVIFCGLLLYCKHKESDTDQTLSSAASRFYSLDPEGKLYVYEGKQLLTWSMLITRALAVVLSWRVWAVVPCVVCLAWGITTLIIVECPHAELLDTKRMDAFAGYLRVFIAFMLGLYMQTSFQRWWDFVTSYKHVLASVKQLIWTLYLMGVRSDLIDKIQRKALVACYILEAEMHTDLSMNIKDCQGHFESTYRFLEREKLIRESELTRLEKGTDTKHLSSNIGGRSSLVMAWLGHEISRIQEEPGIRAPMYVRLVALIHTFMNNAEDLKTAATVQVPFTYSYLLALLVHFNNILLAVTSGFNFAAALEEVKEAQKDVKESDSRPEALRAIGMVYQAFQLLWTQMVFLVLTPLMYQSFLGIAHALNRPFGKQIFHLPSETFIKMLREELSIMTEGFLAERLRGFDPTKSALSAIKTGESDDEPVMDGGDGDGEGEHDD
mmetsp:Transcript_153538/g.278959  ORF Transcript_153538/g.278959 Transcript_153538/m.278959 type:complete len:532 (+) Transcript_153538:128-1723(+)